MKEEFIIELDTNYQRPVVKINGFNALVDTGAKIPVVSLPEKVLEIVYHAECVIDNAQIKGFGGSCFGKVYKLQSLKIGKLIYPNLHVFVPDEPMDEFEIIISATMLNGLIYEINTRSGNMLIQVPDEEQCIRNLVLYDKNGQLHILIN